MGLKKTLILVSLLLLPWTVSAQFYSLRTNVAALATGNLNAEFSMTLNRKWSVHLPLQYCPFKFNANRQWRNIYTSPGVRYWLRESYTGGFIGLHGVAAVYSVGGLFGNKFRHEGEGYGAGLSIGHAYALAKRWNLEWELGGGPVWLAYDKYACRHCGGWKARESGWYLLPTKLAFNVVYLF